MRKYFKGDFVVCLGSLTGKHNPGQIYTVTAEYPINAHVDHEHYFQVDNINWFVHDMDYISIKELMEE